MSGRLHHREVNKSNKHMKKKRVEAYSKHASHSEYSIDRTSCLKRHVRLFVVLVLVFLVMMYAATTLLESHASAIPTQQTEQHQRTAPLDVKSKSARAEADATVITRAPFGVVTRRLPGTAVEELLALYERLTPKALLEMTSQFHLTPSEEGVFRQGNETTAALAMESFPFWLPPLQRREYLMEKVHTFLGFGTRVAGSSSRGQRKALEFIVREGSWQPRRDGLFHAAYASQLPTASPHWRMEWDNFTANTPLGEKEFTNVLFHFGGGSAFQKRRQTVVERARNLSPNKGEEGQMTIPKLQHIVLSAHWDSKYFKDIEFLGATDSAVPVILLLETIRSIAVLTDVEAVLRTSLQNKKEEDDCSPLMGAFSSELLALMQYFYASDEAMRHCLGGTLTQGNRTMYHWRHLLKRIENLPAISVVFFDGEEAFMEWKNNDHTYGSRHLAEEWKKQPSPFSSNRTNTSRFDSVDLFVLYDLMGAAGSQFHNYFPDQSGIMFAHLAKLENAKRKEASELYYPNETQRTMKPTNHNPNQTFPNVSVGVKCSADAREETGPAQPMAAEGQADMSHCLTHMPSLWCRFSPSPVMFTLHGVPHTFGSLGAREDIAALWVDPKHRKVTDDWNIFFPTREGLARGPFLRKGFHVEDDHIHWMETGRVLHLIPLPFPITWHTEKDNMEGLDPGTVHDLHKLLTEFALDLGMGWAEGS